jgi:hypothetical protein
MDAFDIDIIAVCKNQKEYDITEIFWTLFYNKAENQDGYDLSINNHYNAIIGDLVKDTSRFVSKPTLTIAILDGLESGEIMQKFRINSYETINNLFDKYYGKRKLKDIRTLLIQPVLELCIKNGYNEEQTMEYLIKSGIKFISIYSNTKLLLSKYTKLIWGKNFVDTRYELFITPYTNYLVRQGFEVFNENPEEMGMIDLLVLEGLGYQGITYTLGLCKPSDPKPIKDKQRSLIRTYLRRKWGFKTAAVLATFIEINNLRILSLRISYLKEN